MTNTMWLIIIGFPISLILVFVIGKHLDKKEKAREKQYTSAPMPTRKDFEPFNREL